MTIDFTTWLPQIINWIVIAVIVFIAYRGFTHVISNAVKDAVHNEVNDAINRLDDKIKGLNAIRNLKR